MPMFSDGSPPILLIALLVLTSIPEYRIMQLFSPLIGMLFLYTTTVHATTWVVGYQSSGYSVAYTSWNIRQVRSIVSHLNDASLMLIFSPL